MKVEVDPGYAADVASTGKRERSRLAKSELWMLASVWAAAHACDVADRPRPGDSAPGLPFDEWPKDDALRWLGARYGLTAADIERLLMQLSDECVTKALHSGYDGAWL